MPTPRHPLCYSQSIPATEDTDEIIYASLYHWMLIFSKDHDDYLRGATCNKQKRHRGRGVRRWDMRIPHTAGLVASPWSSFLLCVILSCRLVPRSRAITRYVEFLFQVPYFWVTFRFHSLLQPHGSAIEVLHIPVSFLFIVKRFLSMTFHWTGLFYPDRWMTPRSQFLPLLTKMQWNEQEFSYICFSTLSPQHGNFGHRTLNHPVPQRW
jgi:hypothetical protein